MGLFRVSLEVTFLHSQLEERKRRLEQAIALTPRNAGLAGLLREVDSALERMDKGRYGLCEECHEPVEQDRLGETSGWPAKSS